MRHSFTLGLLLLPALASAQEFKMEPPKSPADSLKCIKVRPGFKVELMAAEPLVMDPIAFAWGPDGKFWVVEMGDYPLGADGKNKPGGKIKYLEKTKPDGPYDKMTVFMEGIGYPTGVFPYARGVLVTCAPDIFYAEVGANGGIRKEVIFTGFKEGNQQHRVNGLTWGIDNWIYGANGDSGGQIEAGKKTGLLTREIKEGFVDIRGRDFRFKVETGEFEAVSGQSQFGRCRDDWGNWFGCNNSNPMFHFVLEDRYLKRNPHVLYPDVRVQVPIKPGAQPVFPISKPLPRFNTPQGLNHFTSACSTIIYRDNLFGPAFEGNMFVSEPVHNLIHREIMKPKGVTFTSQRADDEQTSEFLASSDNWFRPAMIQVGPDGALWIADMYRYVIEHPEWIPKDWQKKLDLRAGHDLGRIYRVYPEGKKPREIPNIDKMSTPQWLEAMKSPNGWTRDTVHQLIVQRPVGAELPKIVRGLEILNQKGENPATRLHAFYAHGWLTGWNRKDLAGFATDVHPALRKHTLEALGVLILKLNADEKRKLLDVLAIDENLQVRQQLAYCLGREADSPTLARLLRENAENPYILAAGLSSLSHEWKPTFAALMGKEELPPALLTPLLRMARAIGEPTDVNRLIVWQLKIDGKLPASQQMLLVGDLLEALQKNGQSMDQVLKSAGPAGTGNTLAHLKTVHANAGKTAANSKAPMAERMVSIRLLARGLGDDRADHKLLLTFLTPQTPDDVQAAVIQQIGGAFDPRVPGLLLGPWKSYSPALRGQVLDTLLSRAIWTKMTLEAIKQKQIPAQEIDAIRRQRFLQHKDSEIRDSARTLFASASNSDRGKLVDLTWLQMPDEGDATRGAKLFAKSCATCHKLGDVGQNVGPDFAAIGDKSVQGLLTAILDPNRAVESRYISYVASTKKGLTYNGILSAETSTTITLTAPDGKTHQLLRNELDELASSGKSMMPEGLEKDLSPQDLADVIEHVRVSLSAPKSKD